MGIHRNSKFRPTSKTIYPVIKIKHSSFAYPKRHTQLIVLRNFFFKLQLFEIKMQKYILGNKQDHLRNLYLNNDIAQAEKKNTFIR